MEIQIKKGRWLFLNDFFRFLRSPKQEAEKEFTAFEKVRVLLYSFILILVGAAISITIRNNFEQLQLIKEYKNMAIPLPHEKDIFIYLKVIFIGPLVEEMAFRKSLIFSKRNFALSLSFLSFLFLSEVFSSSYELNTALLVKILTGALLYFFCVAYIRKDKEFMLANAFEKHYGKVFYATAIAFGYLHLFNYGSISLEILMASPVLVLMFIIYGIVFGYVRVTLGFSWALVLHMILNTFIRLIKLI